MAKAAPKNFDLKAAGAVLSQKKKAAPEKVKNPYLNIKKGK